ncbi:MULTISPECIES: 5-carboxymethyl-2-hydroxymuconate Delta-isomerase [Rhodopseudomonas]|uniref:5-carboxymethyl-2-hydroxymuconate isomerase n=1 Tax=Rhodopseudomonas palustris TaxID=1076 RepID=A0A0D7EA20_RHOPL|nr:MULTISPECIES: 5-carboxymethyl-2-hydroxymuconate Delta-isomerase [Rhodopseudomonas]KIZ36422.1 5-carboxymethyl-2-hydroxymuconate isomerase [Rhodopseudomonas palustris]MDF3812182.1 5-carboxymethyl-2-hydroxymuconate Delta-isomerase [Rhodopseudomonas sp. BAL398]WOK18112.1 5-carboxymethyl-2-hydroxymuconate Delta-isomerase [Rhodopseudomonas sp. BAL398]
MPHFTLEYSAALEDLVDIAEIVELVRIAAIETGMFPLGGIRVRAIRCDDYAIADGRDGLNFLAMLLRLGEGRDLAARKKAGDHIFNRLSHFLDPLFAEEGFALSFDIQVIDKDTSWKRNSIHDLLVAEAKHG